VTGDPDDPRRAPRVSLAWARQMIETYGRESAFVRSKVLGLFPHRAADALIGLDQYEESFGRPFERGLRTLGVDVARGGEDSTVYARRDGTLHEGVERAPQGQKTDVTASQVHQLMVSESRHEVRVDDIGVGGGVTDNLLRLCRESGAKYRVVPIIGSSAATKKKADPVSGKEMDLYANLRAQGNMEMREHWFGKGVISLDESLRRTSLGAQCTDLRVGFGRNGRVFQVESKDDFKQRHNGQSPDDWDATWMAFCEVGQSGHAGLKEWMRQRAAEHAGRRKKEEEAA
jgi:phage terminase large subunit